MRTGGGPPPKPAEDPDSAKILSLIGDELADLGNELDSDSAPSKYSDMLQTKYMQKSNIRSITRLILLLLYLPSTIITIAWPSTAITITITCVSNITFHST